MKKWLKNNSREALLRSWAVSQNTECHRLTVDPWWRN